MKGPAPPPPDSDAMRQEVALLAVKQGGARSTAWHLTGRWKMRPLLWLVTVWVEEYRFTYAPIGDRALVQHWLRATRWRRARFRDVPSLMVHMQGGAHDAQSDRPLASFSITKRDDGGLDG